jgi:hypothetical protein
VHYTHPVEMTRCHYIEDTRLRYALDATITILNDVLGTDALRFGREYMPHSINIVPMLSYGCKNPDAGLVAGLIDADKAAIQKIDTSQSLVGTTLYVSEIDLQTKNPQMISKGYYNLHGITIVEGVMCPYCKQHVCKSDMDQHLLSPQCYLDTETLKVKEMGYEQVFDINEMIAVRQSVVAEYKMVPTYITFYVPPWVGQALKIYRESNGFADMTLTEFLATMKPGNEK